MITLLYAISRSFFIMFFKKKQLEGISPFCGATEPLFWTSSDVCPGFQSHGGSFSCVLPCLHGFLRFTSGATPTDLLKIYVEAYTNEQCIGHKNNIAQLYFMLGRTELCWNFSSWFRDAADIYRFPVLHMVKTHFLLGNLWISGPFLGTLENSNIAQLSLI